MSPAHILLIGSVCAMIFYHAINVHELKTIYQKCIAKKNLWFKCNLSIALIWICAVYSPPMIGAALYTFLFFSVFGLLGRIGLYTTQTQQNMSQIISIIALIGIISYVIIIRLYHDTTAAVFFGTLLACLGGIGAFIYSKQAAMFMKSSMRIDY